MEHLTINQVAKELNCHPNTVRQHLADWVFLKWQDLKFGEWREQILTESKNKLIMTEGYLCRSRRKENVDLQTKSKRSVVG